ncbi:MAG: CotH kinase family protein [Bacteroidota bacterium]
MKKMLLAGLFLLFGTNHLSAQAGKNLFDPNVLHEISFTFSEVGFWDSLLVNYGDSSSFSGSDIAWEMAETMEIDGTILDSVGVRLRGKSSFRHASEFKKPFKIDLNEYVRGQAYDGMKKFNLHNGACDPSQLRDFIAYDVLRTAGVKAPRVSHARVYINGQYWGLYSIIEQIDKTFVQNNFSNGSGNLYKNNAWSQLEWLGTDLAAYQEDIELKTNETEADWSDFLEFVDILNNTPDSTFAEAIQKVFNVESYLRVLAADIGLNNWDSYVDNRRNWYLYHNPETDLFEWIPWDYNLSMGGDFAYTANPYRPVTPGCEIVAEFDYYQQGDVVFFIDKSEPAAQEWSWDFGNNNTSNLPMPVANFSDQEAVEVCLTVKRLAGTEVCTHTRCRAIELDFVVADCVIDSGTVSPYPITDPIFQIVTRADDFCCSESWDAVCESNYQAILTGQDTIGELGVDYTRDLPLFVKDSSKVLIVRLLQVPEFRQRFLELTCVMMATNLTKSRITNLINRQTALIRPAIYQEPYAFFSKDFYEYDVGNGTGGGNDVNIPPLQYFLDQRIPQMFDYLVDAGESCQMAFSAIGFQDITINELVATNQDSLGGQADAAGEFDDWLELYNNTEQDIDLTGYFLTDNFAQPLKWAFPPNTTISAGDYLIVWADKDGDQAGLHANFRLDRDGEQLMLSRRAGTSRMINTV